ncbi:FAD-dependent oxidoreductase [Agromyces sp. Marseille-P2726]|uniref:FAD-dependent oxidoreductase n=1 Tax=Agromyces sp. Marseille-P2726 TaxID=2709132 RepID=UPI0015710260|nr:FAD-dependent oxidoreductase [Agromyces sp. Marseille-P2726]
MTSLWTAAAIPDESEPTPTSRYEGVVDPGERFDVAVVGAGITGLATAIMLVQGGMRVVVLEAERVAALASGLNTGKASVLQGAMLQRIRSTHSARVVRGYADANLDGQRWIAEFCEHHGVPVSVETAYSYARSDSGLRTVDREVEAAIEAGLPAERVDALDVPFPFSGAVALPGQLGLDPYRLVVAMARTFVAEGGVLLEGMRVQHVHADRPVELQTPRGVVRADVAVVATGAPTLLRGLYWAKTSHNRSYLTSYRIPEELADVLPSGLFISVDSPTRSVRTTPDPESGVPDAAPPVLLVGGNGHPVGRIPSNEERVLDLVDWTGRFFPGAELTHRWAAQDYTSANLVPFVGRMPRGRGRIWTATGYAKWGLTNGAAAAIRISEEILGVPWMQRRSWIRVLGTRVSAPADLGRGAAENAQIAAELTAGYARAQRHPAPARKPAEGEGVVVSRGGVPYGVSTVDGVTCAVRAVCTHLGGPLTWNDAEHTWDCPLHASRFTATGTRIEGPAVRDLHRERRGD